MAQQTTLKPNALPGPVYGSFAGKEEVTILIPTGTGTVEGGNTTATIKGAYDVSTVEGGNTIATVTGSN